MPDQPSFDITQFGGEVHCVLVVAAHPDDLETACGGTVLLLIRSGIAVSLLLATDGDIGTHDPSFTRATLAATRREETLNAARLLGLETVRFLGHHDGELVADLPLRAEVAAAYRSLQPDTIFTFDPYWSGQAHPDHTAVGRAAVDAYMPSKMELYHPEQLADGTKVADVKRFFFFGGSNREGEITIDISAAWDSKVAATRCHESQFGQKEEALQWLSDWNHETGKCCGIDYAEAFHPMRVW
jgi:LmbE family N-acetylglucosaminyl deacetylase